MLFRYVAFTFLSAAVSLPGMAQGRPDARAMTCAQVHDFVAARGGVVMTTGRHTYERVVVGTRFCSFPEVALPLTIGTRDGERCVVRVCRPDPYDD